MPNSPPTPPAQPGAPLRSAFAGDPDMAELVRQFAEEMPRRIEALTACWEKQEMEELRRLAHQLKGAGGGYGFGEVGEGARRLEDTIESLARSNGRSSGQALRDAFEGLMNLCRRVRAD